MRILVVSNFYPPHFIGGYELGCRDAVEALRGRGHDVVVLTSTYKVAAPEVDGGVHRRLRVHTDFHGIWRNEPLSLRHVHHVLRRELANRDALIELVHAFHPQVIHFWNLGFVSLSLISYAKRLGVPLAFYVFDAWVESGEKNDQWAQLIAAPHWTIKGRLFDRSRCMSLLAPCLGLLRPPFIADLPNLEFASEYLRKAAAAAGRDVTAATVIHWGLDLASYPYRRAVSRTKLLFVGQIVPQKGVDTIIEAMRIVAGQDDCKDVQLTIVGGSVLADYEASVKAKVGRYDLEDRVHFAGLVPREAIPSLMLEHDILLFPTVWEEPFGISILEAMACGLPVVGTATGGSAEMLIDDVTGLRFRPKDVDGCVRQILRLVREPETFERIRSEARKTVEQRFEFSRTIDTMESHLTRVAAA